MSETKPQSEPTDLVNWSDLPVRPWRLPRVGETLMFRWKGRSVALLVVHEDQQAGQTVLRWTEGSMADLYWMMLNGGVTFTDV